MTQLAQPDLLYNEIETELREHVRDLLHTRSPSARVLSRLELGEPYDQQLWHPLVREMGLAALAVPERLGGAGARLREAAVVLEELGRAVAPVPYLSSAVVATSVLVAAEEADLLGKLCAGESIAVLAVPLSTDPAALSPTVAVQDGRLTGEITSVADGLAADVLLVPAADGVYLVEASAEGVTRRSVVALDQTRPLADVRLEGAAGRPLAVTGSAKGAVSQALTVGAALLASEQLGLAEWCLSSTVEHLKARHQFGRPVGSFQALKHRLADVWVDLAQARAVARYAAACAASGDADLPVAASLAQAFCSPVAVKAAEECVQLHGGIGFTWEHPAHLYLKRAVASASAFGSAERHRMHLAGLIDLPS